MGTVSPLGGLFTEDNGFFLASFLLPAPVVITISISDLDRVLIRCFSHVWFKSILIRTVRCSEKLEGLLTRTNANLNLEIMVCVGFPYDFPV